MVIPKLIHYSDCVNHIKILTLKNISEIFLTLVGSPAKLASHISCTWHSIYFMHALVNFACYIWQMVIKANFWTVSIGKEKSRSSLLILRYNITINSKQAAGERVIALNDGGQWDKLGQGKSIYSIAGASIKTKPLDFSANSLVALLKRHAHSLEQSAFDIFSF